MTPTSSSLIFVTQLLTYPVKSCGSINHDEVTLSTLGLKNDRVFMLIRSDKNRFLTQRQHPTLSLIQTNLLPNNRFQISHGKQQITIARPTQETSAHTVAGIWDDNVLVHDAGDAAAKFFKDFLGPSLDYNVRLVSILNEKQHYRPTSPEHTPPAAYCGFGSSLPNSSLADGFPILIANESSLDEINRRLKLKNRPSINMNRFRPNIVIKGAAAFEEDTWKAIKINGHIFHVVKNCPRCKQSTVVQEEGRHDSNNEPLETLNEFRQCDPTHPDDVFFGQNVCITQLFASSVSKSIGRGDKVEILKCGKPKF